MKRETLQYAKATLALIVGLSMQPVGVAQQLYWLGVLAGGNFSIANDVSDDGSVVVGFSYSGAGDRAFRWVLGGTMVNLGIPSNTVRSYANALTADGTMVFGSAASSGGAWRSLPVA